MVIAPDDIEWDDANCEHATRHGVSVDEITQALRNGPTMRRNRKGRAATHLAYGVTDAGRRVVIAVGWNQWAGTVRPITAWEQP